MSIRLVMSLAVALTLAGCATGPVNSLSEDTRNSLRIDSVEVTYAPGAKVEWFDAQGDGPVEPAAQLAFLQQKAIGPIKAALDAEIPPTFRGTQSATLKVQIRYVRIPAAAIRIIVANGPYIIRADLALVDTKSGKTLLAATDFNGLSPSFGGVAGILESAVADDPIIRVSKSFAHVLQVWLKTGQKLAMG